MSFYKFFIRNNIQTKATWNLKPQFHTRNRIRKKIIVFDVGFAGIQLARRLEENLFDVLLIDKIKQQHSRNAKRFIRITIVNVKGQYRTRK